MAVPRAILSRDVSDNRAWSAANKVFDFWLVSLRFADHVRVRSIAVILTLFAAFYVVAYLADPALPGGFEFPLGWWGWSDQGLYLKSARAFSYLDFRGSEHTYPILYSLLAAPFVRLMPIHPFFVIDLVCFLTAAGVFLVIGAEIIGLLPSAVIFVCSICIPWIIAPDWIIPWTSTLSAALTSILLLACANERFAEGGASQYRYLGFGLLTGALALTRPLEFFIALGMCAYIAVRCVFASRRKIEPVRSTPLLAIALALIMGVGVGPLVMAAFNNTVYGSVVSPYVQNVRESGYDLATIPQKFVSLFNDSASLFLMHRQTLLARFPWLAVTIAMVPAVLVFGPNILRLITVLAFVHVALYLGYGDLHPHNLYLYHIIHYFKLWMPYFALIAVSGAVFLWQKRKLKQAAYVAGSGVALVIFLCSLGFRFSDVPVQATRIGLHAISVQPAGESQATVDIIDFPNVASDLASKYVCCNNHLVADGKTLRRVGDFQLFSGERAGRPFTRVFFTAGLTFRELVITFDDSFRIPGDVTGDGSHHVIRLRAP